MENRVVLNEITQKLTVLAEYSAKKKYPPSYKDDLTSLNTLSSTLLTYPPSIANFTSFLKQTHDIAVLSDTYIRSLIFRIIRLCLISPAFCEKLIDEEFHIIITSSLDKDGEFSKERMQALKIMVAFFNISPKSFPVCFTRAILATCSQKEDNMRKPCVEVVREICSGNVQALTKANGTAALVDIILDPSLSEYQQPILLTILHALSSPETRRHLRPYIDLRSIISPLTDLDTDPSQSEGIGRLKAAKSALVTIMRSYVGISQLCSDELGFAVLVKLLKDPKVPTQLQDIILDAIIEIFEPFATKLARPRRNISSFASHELLHQEKQQRIDSQSSEASFADDRSTRASKDQRGKSTSIFGFFSGNKTPPSKVKRTVSTARTVNESPNNSVTSEDGSAIDLVNKLKIAVSNEEEGDPIYNLVDNYVAILCCAFIHTNLFDTLCYMSIYSPPSISTKSRELFIDLLRSASSIFPEMLCVELINLPSLIEYASSSSSLKYPFRAHKASRVMQDISNVFLLFPWLQNMVSERPVLSSKTPTLLNKTTNNTLFEMSEEVKKSAQSRVASLQGNDSLNNQNLDVLQDMRTVLMSSVEKNDFNKQMELSKILSKDGKEPLKWDWPLIGDMLEYSFHHPDRLSEALKTKWVRRLSGFFRCSLEEKGYFANMDWEYQNLHYLECACNLYHILVEDSEGTEFLSSDRRGVLFNEMAKELNQLVEQASKGVTGTMMQKNLFRMYGCQYTMTREYFTLLGRLTTTLGGRTILRTTNVFEYIPNLGTYNSLDYLSRLALTSLVFSDRGFLSKVLLQLWASTMCSKYLLEYMVSLLMVLLQSRPQEFLTWGLDVLIGYISNSDNPSQLYYDILELACQDKKMLKATMQRGLKLIDEPMAVSVLQRYACIPEGLSFLKNTGQFSVLLEHWKSKGNREYVKKINQSLAKVLMPGYIARVTRRVSSPIVMHSRSFSAFSLIHPSMNTSVSMVNGNTTSAPFANGNNGISSAMSHIMAPIASQSLSSASTDCTAAAVSLEGLIRAPWSIEVKISNGESGKGGNSIENIRIDTYLDTSELKHPTQAEFSNDDTRIVTVRGIVLNSRGLPMGYSIAPSRSISATLLVGASPVHRDGTIASIANQRAQKRNLQASAMNTSRDSVAQTKRSTSVSGATTTVAADLVDVDLPVSYQLDECFDWSVCSPFHRQSNCRERDDGMLLVEVPGEPVVWVFSRNAPQAQSVSRKRAETIAQPSNNANSARNNTLYLIEVHYLIKIKTGEALFVPLPRHYLGDMASTFEGAELLSSTGTISHLVSSAKSESSSAQDRIASIWAIGHICSKDHGYQQVAQVDANLVDWLVSEATQSVDYGLRGVCFHVLGLVGQSKLGSRRLSRLRWESTAIGGVSAVAIPYDVSQLFLTATLDNERTIHESTESVMEVPSSLHGLSPFIERGVVSYEQEVLNLISKLPGVVPIFKESKARIESIRQQHPQVFKSRELYKAVHQLLETYSFRLTVRREVLRLFENEAKVKK